MYDGLGETRRPSAAETREIVGAILFRKYGYARDDEYANAIVASVREDPVSLQQPRTATAPDKVEPVHGIFRPLKVVVTKHHEIHHIRERGYVERPVRVEKIVQALKSVQDVEFVEVTDHGVAPIVAVHDPDFVDYLSRVCPRLGEKETLYPYVFPIRLRERKPLDEEVQAGYYCIDTFTPLTRNAYTAARASVDCALTGVDQVLAGEHLVYSLCRPPGHHAERRVYGGFCYFNNAAIAANVLSEMGKVAVLDVDFHHGNGTQDIFYDRADVLTVSIHGDPSYAYPYFAGFVDERGEGPGEGFNHNFPLAEGIGDDEYLETLSSALSVIERFAPRFLVVSLGLDIAKGDPTGAWTISPLGLERIGGTLAGLGLPTLAVQEGGYDTRVLGRNATYLLRGLQRGIYERRLVPRV